MSFLLSKIGSEKNVLLYALVGMMLFGASSPAQATRLVFSSEKPTEVEGAFVLDMGNDYDTYEVKFGADISASILFDQIADRFEFNRDVNLGGNEIQNFRLENLDSAPTCDAASNGRIYFNTTDSHTYTCENLNWVRLDQGGLAANSTEQTIDYNSAVVNTITLLSASSANRPADKAFIVKTLGDSNLKTQVATTTGERYFRTYQNSIWSGWEQIKTKKYAGYTLIDIDQTDGTVSYISRTRDTDSKWLITKSDSSGFAYAQIENNPGTTDLATAWNNRLTLNYNTSFAP